MPDDPVKRARSRTWGVYTLEYHDSVNTLTFGSYQRKMLLDKPAEELEARWAAMSDKTRVRKTLDLMEHGAGFGSCSSGTVPALPACALKWKQILPRATGCLVTAIHWRMRCCQPISSVWTVSDLDRCRNHGTRG